MSKKREELLKILRAFREKVKKSEFHYEKTGERLIGTRKISNLLDELMDEIMETFIYSDARKKGK